MGSVRHGRVGQAPEPGRRNPNSDKRASHQAVLPGRARTRFQTLRIDGVSRHFGSTVAVSDLNLTIEGGEFIALLGPSGCGKSTALNCLAGLLPLTTGGIWLDDERIDGLPPEERGFGFVFQSYALFPHMTVRQNVAFGLSIRRMPKDEVRRRVDEALDMVELADHASKLPGQLSGGQQQRVAIARAIVIRPRLFLMDEPLSNLDAKLRLQMRREIRRLHQTLHLTTVYVTHDQEEALALADRVVLLNRGRVQQVGTPEDLYTRPASAYVADFMGYRNLLRLPVVSQEGRRILTGQAGLRLVGVAQNEVVGREAIVAIRPEDFRVAGAMGGGGGAANTLPVRIDVAEYRGSEIVAEGTTEDGGVICFRSLERVVPGEVVRLTVPAERVLVFRADDPTGVRPADPRY
jgi:putative spermidine/putrescine transport system ATP-binding protein